MDQLKIAADKRKCAQLSKLFTASSIILSITGGVLQIALGPESKITQIFTFLSSAVLLASAKLGYDSYSSLSSQANKIESDAQTEKSKNSKIRADVSYQTAKKSGVFTMLPDIKDDFKSPYRRRRTETAPIEEENKPHSLGAFI